MSKDTARNLRVIETDENRFIIYNSQDEYVCGVKDNEANAKRIVHCVNNFDELVNLLKDILEWDGILPHSKVRIKQAIKNAEVK